MSTKQKILVVDDEQDILELISYNLTREGYQVYTVSNGKQAISKAKEVNPDLIILDVMMPVMDGIEACRVMRAMPEFKQTFIVFLTARSEEYSEIAGFHVGADEKRARRIKPRALRSRIHASGRRNTGAVVDEVADKIEISGLVIARDSLLVYRGDEKTVLAKKEFEPLYLLASKPNKVF